MVNRGAFLLLVLVLSHHLLTSAQKISHVVVLMEENRSFDHFFGWYPGVDGLVGNEYNLVNESLPNSGRIYVDKLARYVAPCDPDHGTPATTSKIFGMPAAKKGNLTHPTMSGFVEWENWRGNNDTNYCAVMSMFTPDDLPIMTTLANEFVLMDRFFAAYPGPTWPNRLYFLSGTSYGLTETEPWFEQKPGNLFPQPTIFDQLEAEGMTWRNYYNDTPWELMMASIAHHPENLQTMEQFYLDAQRGTLPNFAWLNPRLGIDVHRKWSSNDQHPDHDIAMGEQFYKDIYEALRASPQWNETLFIVTFDEHGGFYDHVPPPMGVPPPGDNIPSFPDKGIEFNRLGIRIPTLLISPWVPKGVVLSGPPAAQKPAPNSEYTLTSIIASVRKILGFSNPAPLTKRDAWSATFEQMLSEPSPRTDCPVHLPDAPPVSPLYSLEKEAAQPINGLQEYVMTVHAHLADVDYPHHLKTQGEVTHWAQHHFQLHKERTLQWKQSKAVKHYRVAIDSGYYVKWASTLWNVTLGPKFATIATLNNTMCLDWDATLMTVGISSCYPSYDPNKNRDVQQQWIWGENSMVYPNIPGLPLCFTNDMLHGGDKTVFLRACNQYDVGQRWAYDGWYLYFGGDEYIVGLFEVL